MVHFVHVVASGSLALAASALSETALGVLQGLAGGNCLDLPGGDAVNGAELWLWECNGHASQKWAFDNGELKYDGGLVWLHCVDLPGNDQSDGKSLWLWECSGLPQQQWGYDSWGQTVYLASSDGADASKCLDARNGGFENGGEVWIWDCLPDADNQKWLLSSEPIPPTPSPAPSPAGSCSVGDSVICPNSVVRCGGNQCCPDGSTCPSADNSFSGCSGKIVDCTQASLI